MTKRKKVGGFMGGEPWEAVDLGAPIHTALRKCCDSTITSLAYNLVSGLDQEWRLFLDAIKQAIDAKFVHTNTLDAMSASMLHWLKEAPLGKGPRDAFDRERWEKLEAANEGVRARYYALTLAFELFAPEDMQGALYYLFDDAK